MSNENREGRRLRAELCPDDPLARDGDGLESEVAVGEVREVDILVEVEGGVSRLEGMGMGEVSEGTGEPREPVMPSMLN